MVDGVKGVDRAVLIRTSMGSSRRSVKKRQVLSQSLAVHPSISPAGTAAIRFAYVHAPKAANTLVLCRISTWRNPTLRSRSSWYISGRGVSSWVT